MSEEIMLEVAVDTTDEELLALRAYFDKKSSTSPISIVIRNETRDEVSLADINEQRARKLAAEPSAETA